MKRFLLIFLIASSLLFLVSCTTVEPEPTPFPHWTLIPTPTPLSTEVPEEKTEAVNLHSPLFSLSLPEFIERYNAVYEREYGFTPLHPAEEWNELTPQGELRLWRFAGDQGLSAEPTICVWAGAEEAPMERISLGFSDHGYTDENRERYEKLCLCTFLSAGFDSAVANRLFDSLFPLSMDSAYAVGDYDELDIKTLYHDGAVGLYPWYSGGIAHIDLIPVSPEVLDTLAQGGAELVDFRDWSE